MRFTNKNVSRKAAAITAATALTVFGGAGAAIAYWTTSGSGTGSASTGDVQAVTVTQTAVVSGLVPGGAPVALSGKFNNPNPGAVTVASVSASVTGTSAGSSCTAADFDITGTGAAAGEIPSGTGVGSWSGLSIALKDRSDVNQNGCKNATVNLSYTAS
jgi:hypothetical protein